MASSELSLRAVVGGLALALAGCATAPARPTAAVTLRGEAGPVALPELLARAEATVVVFWSAGCPCVRRYQARVEALKARFEGRVAFVAVSANADESLASVSQAARERGVSLPLYRDEGGELARALGARSTPTVLLLRRDGQVLYQGWLDNERQPGEPGREPWLEQALEGFTSGRPFAARSPTWGCTITRSLGQSATCHDTTTQGAAP